jgi:hypothetical protein
LVIISFKFSYALFTSNAVSSNNTFTAASVFPSVSVSPTPVPITPSVTPSPTPATSNLYLSDQYTCSNGAATIESIKGTVSITKTTALNITVTLMGALPLTTYDLWVNQDPGACPLSSPTSASFITTDGNGNGSSTLSDHSLAEGATNYWVSMVGGSDVLRSTAVSF